MLLITLTKLAEIIKKNKDIFNYIYITTLISYL